MSLALKPAAATDAGARQLLEHLATTKPWNTPIEAASAGLPTGAGAGAGAGPAAGQRPPFQSTVRVGPGRKPLTAEDGDADAAEAARYAGATLAEEEAAMLAGLSAGGAPDA
jgi:hypothetical protein